MADRHTKRRRHERPRDRLRAAAVVAALLCVTPSARAADPSEGSAAAAEALFQEGRKLMDAKHYGDACPKFLASHKMAPAVGTLLNLADCYEKNGQFASAWARFHEAVALARRLGRPDREKVARDRADKLEPRLLKLTITAEEPNVTVTLDGAALDPAALGSPVPVDPGKHVIEATAKGKRPFTTTLEIGERAKSSRVEIPALEAEPEPPKEEPRRAPPPPPPAPEEGSRGGAQRTLGVIAMGAGVVGVAVGTVFGLRTSSTWSEAQTHCRGIDCDATGVDLANQARSSGNISTVAFVAGGALLAGGAVLYFTAPRDPARAGAAPPAQARVRMGVGVGSLIVGGTF